MKNNNLALIKPTLVKEKKIGEIISFIERNGFNVKQLKLMDLSEEIASKFYAIHKDKPFYADLIEFMTSSPIVAMILEKEN